MPSSLPTELPKTAKLARHFLVLWEIYVGAPDGLRARLEGLLNGHSTARLTSDSFIVAVTFDAERGEIFEKFKAVSLETTGQEYDFFAFIIGPEIEAGPYIGRVPEERWDEINRRTIGMALHEQNTTSDA